LNPLVALAAAAGGELPDPAADRLPAAVAGGARPLSADGAAVQGAERRGRQPQRPRTALAAVRTGSRGITVVRLGVGAGNAIIPQDS